MPVSVLLLTHADIGHALQQLVTQTFGAWPKHWRTLTMTYQHTPEILFTKLQETLESMRNPDGILILADLYGATPCNMACALPPNNTTHVVSGVNAAMLFKVMNYAHLPLAELTTKAVDGGREGILSC